MIQASIYLFVLYTYGGFHKWWDLQVIRVMHLQPPWTHPAGSASDRLFGIDQRRVKNGVLQHAWGCIPLSKCVIPG